MALGGCIMLFGDTAPSVRVGRRSAQARYCFRRADWEDTYDCHLLYFEARARPRLVVMRTLHLGLRVADLERSIAFYTSLGYEMLGDVPATELGTLTMLKLPGDEFCGA